MKKFNLKYVISFFVALLLLSSCLGNQRNVIQSSTFGVMRYDYEKQRYVLDVSEDESCYHIQFQTASEDDCFWIYYELDYESPENTLENVMDSKGNMTYNVSLIDKKPVDLGSVYYAVDTSSVKPGEVAIIDPMYDGVLAYIRGKMFIVSTMNIPDNQDMWWELSFDFNNLVTEVGGRRYYDLYLRSTIKDKGTKTPEERMIAISFDMFTYLKSVVQKEKELSGEDFRLRIHYPSAISEEGEITWKYKESQSIPVSLIY